MLELSIMIAMLIIAALAGLYIHRKYKVKATERQRHYDSFVARRDHRISTASSRRDDPMSDPMHPLNPIGFTSPISPLNPLNAASQSDDSTTRSYSCDSSSSWSSSDSGISSSDSGSSYSSCD